MRELFVCDLRWLRICTLVILDSTFPVLLGSNYVRESADDCERSNGLDFV